MEQSILNLQHLTKSFDGKKILDDLSIDIERNEFVTLLRHLPAAARQRHCVLSVDLLHQMRER